MADKAKINLDGLSVQELTTLIQDAENKRREALEEAKASLIAEMEEKAAAIGLSLQGMLDRPSQASSGRKTRKDAGAPVAAKYRGPNGEEWSGRGRPPTWLTKQEAAGKNREAFRT
ncbi:H-NS family nucleoid-associated regulatory protein [Roseomonas sp. BN140053]|uniref:H-NS histone family protein n=1 Tax=Roseomonas sp. BN140053 TaxID=3391898 RepID=UPI0039E882DB